MQQPLFCFWDCEAKTIEFLSVIIRTNGPGDAELIIDGPAGDQARLPVHVTVVERFQIVDVVSGSILEAIDSNTYFVRLETYDSENTRLAAQGKWNTEPPDTIPLSVKLFDESSDLLEYSATAFLVNTTGGTTTLQVSVGETTLEIPVER